MARQPTAATPAGPVCVYITPPTSRSLFMLWAMFVDPRPLLQRYVAKTQPTYPLKPSLTPAHFILNQSAHLPTDVPMLTAVLVTRQLPRQRGRHTFLPSPPKSRCLVMLWVGFADHTPMLQRYVAKTQLTYPPKPPTLPIHPLSHRRSDGSCCIIIRSTTAATPRYDAFCCTINITGDHS